MLLISAAGRVLAHSAITSLWSQDHIHVQMVRETHGLCTNVNINQEIWYFSGLTTPKVNWHKNLTTFWCCNSLRKKHNTKNKKKTFTQKKFTTIRRSKRVLKQKATGSFMLQHSGMLGYSKGRAPSSVRRIWNFFACLTVSQPL